MKKCYTFALAGLFGLFVSCTSKETDELSACKKNAEQFAKHFYNLNFNEAAKLCTPESQKWLKFYASNLHQEDLDVLNKAEFEASATADDYALLNDSMVNMACTLHDFYEPDDIGKVGTVHDEASLHLLMVRRDGTWYVKMEGLPQSEMQSPD